jgi:hypothetical protein
MSPAPVIVRHEIPAEIVALSPETVAEVARLLASAEACDVTDLPSLEVAEHLFRDIDALGKSISAQRLEVTRPLDALKKQIMAAERDATKALQQRREALGGQVLTFRRKLEAERREAERRAREEAERRERERLQRQREREEAARREAEERAAAEAALFGGEPEPAPVVVEPEPEPEPEPAVAMPAVPDAPAAVRAVRRTRVDIYDEAALVRAACQSGDGRLYGRQVLTIDKRAAEALAKAGVEVPGVRLVEVESIASSGRR